MAAQAAFSGKVVDKVTREPLELAIVTNSKTKETVVTDAQGIFLVRSATPSSSLYISYIGYKTLSVKLDDFGIYKPLIVEMEKGQLDLQQVTIINHVNNLTTSRTLTSIDLNMQPVKSAQDLMRLVPGLFIAQQVGGGKAEQIFLRGFDADHGTDVNVSVDGIQVNLPSQAHGQGWADLHFLIPETVGNYDFGKGPYYTGKGDFTTAGYVGYNTLNALEKNMVKIEAGQFNTVRAVALLNLLDSGSKNKGQSAYVAAEGLFTNGPFDYPQHFNRFNFFGKFISAISPKNNLFFSISAFSSKWRASGEIPNRAISEGYVPDRFGVIDSGQGGKTSKIIANIKLRSALDRHYNLENQFYYTHTYFNLFTNFTFYYVDPVNGDEFNQHEVRDLFGYNGKLSRHDQLSAASLISTAGIDFRYDATHPSWLSHSLDGYKMLNYLQLGNIREANLNGYVDETLEWGRWLFNAGFRLDYFNFYYLNSAPASDTAASVYSGLQTTRTKAVVSPKINIQYTVSGKLQLYVKTGKGFHSNDARVVIANENYQVLPAAYGADIGINWKPAPRLFVNAALWYIYLQQEFTYGSDFGDESVTPGGKTVRKGFDFSARYQITDWLFGNINLNFAIPRAADSASGHNYLPTAPTLTNTARLTFQFKNGWNGAISYRYLHDRPANSDYNLTALGYFLADLAINYTRKKYELGFSVENLFNQKWFESQVEYVSRLKFEPSPVDEVSYTAGVPFFARLKFSVFF